MTDLPFDPLTPVRHSNLRSTVRTLLTASCALLTLSAGAAERDLADLSIEELLNETITSVSKREQKLGDAAAAISVLSNDDLRRSGATNIADALRLVPGVNVGAVTSSDRAISARGFNYLYTNKLLVLVDGRAVYTALFGGVYWDLQQMALEDVDRIEIIRGPGATIWGANAVNGVINIVTRTAQDTQGVVAYGGLGSAHQSMAGVRFGDQFGEHSYYRVFVDTKEHAEYSLADGRGADDGWQSHHGGLRVDHYPQDGRHITWQADFAGVSLDNETTSANNVNTLGRWTERLSERSSFEAQLYYDHTYRNEELRSRNVIDTFDIAIQHTLGVGARHDLIWGLGYRFIETKIERTSPFAAINDDHIDLRLFSAFVQDEYQLIPDKLLLTAGTKLEHHVFTGFEWQPSIRAAFKPTAQQTLWAAASRAVGTPNIVQATDAIDVYYGEPFPGPGGFYVPALVGNHALEAEVLWAYELGYRIQPTRNLSIDVAVFYNDYDNLVSFGAVDNLVPGVPFGVAEIPWSNVLSAHSRGAELSLHVSPTDAWRLIATYSALSIDLHGINNSNAGDPEDAPRHQASLRSAYDFGQALSLNLQLRHVASTRAVPGYTTADIDISYRPTRQLELTLTGRNLFRQRQLEQPVIPPIVTSEVPRTVYGKLAWRF